MRWRTVSCPSSKRWEPHGRRNEGSRAVDDAGGGGGARVAHCRGHALQGSVGRKRQCRRGDPRDRDQRSQGRFRTARDRALSLIHISEPTRLLSISYAVFCLKKKMKLLVTSFAMSKSSF